MFSNLDMTTPWGYSLMALGFYVCLLVRAWVFRSKVPMVGVQSSFELRLVSSFRFYTHAEAILLDGYTKVGRSFLVGDMIVNIDLVQRQNFPVHTVGHQHVRAPSKICK